MTALEELDERAEREERRALPGRVICPHCHDANEHGDYEGTTCEVCLGDGKVDPDDLYRCKYCVNSCSQMHGGQCRDCWRHV